MNSPSINLDVKEVAVVTILFFVEIQYVNPRAENTKNYMQVIRRKIGFCWWTPGKLLSSSGGNRTS